MMLRARKQNLNIFISRSLLRSLDCRKKFIISTTGNSRFHSSDSGEKVSLASTTGHHDVAIVGGGMVGLAFACALSCHPVTKQLRVAIIDNNPTLQSQASIMKTEIPDPRVSTVTPATISFFKEMGAWDYVEQQRHAYFEQQRHAYFDQMQVWDYTGLGYTRYNARDVGKECLGCVVENKVLCNSLLACVQNADFQKSIYTARLASMTMEEPTRNDTLSGAASSCSTTAHQVHHGRLVKMDLDNGKSLYSKLVVGADGSKSRVREIYGIKTTAWNYSQNAVICTVEHTETNHCAWQRFLPSGPIALLPIGDRFSNIVWTMKPEEALNHKSMSKEDFVKAVNYALDYGYGAHPKPNFLDQVLDRFTTTASTTECFQAPPKITSVVTERLSFPLSLMHAHEYASKRVALIGDAAHAVHPLAGQGVNLGFGDASALAKIIAEGLSVGAEIGELSILKKYENERKTANMAMMAILDGCQKAYSIDLGPINILRAAALHGAQYIAPLKRNIINYAMGEQKWPIFS